MLAFLKEHPEADGRGIVVAILDTGIELEHPALQTTSTGEPKIIDVFDGTDDGYLPLPIETKSGGEAIRGITGRILTPRRSSRRLGCPARRDHRSRLLPRRACESPQGRAAREWQRARAAWESGRPRTRARGRTRSARRFQRLLRKDGDPGDLFDVAACTAGTDGRCGSTRTATAISHGRRPFASIGSAATSRTSPIPSVSRSPSSGSRPTGPRSSSSSTREGMAPTSRGSWADTTDRAIR